MQKKDFLLAVFITFVWGINFSIIKLGLLSLNPFMLAGLRFLLCAIPLIFFIKKPNVSMVHIASYGLIFGVGLWGMVSLGIYFGISAGVASLVLQLSAFFTVILGSIVLHEKIQLHKKLGFVTALVGIAFIISITDGTVTYLGLSLVLVGAISWSIANIIVKKTGTKEVFAFLIYASIFSPIPLFLLAYLTQGDSVFVNFFENLDGKAIFSILFQVYPTTLMGYWVWNSLLHKYPASSVAPLSLLVPIFGLLGSYFVFNEPIGSLKISACFLIILGLIINTFGSNFKFKRVFEKTRDIG
ncbi:EamA family transporter [Sulfurospirillum diekertiae]|uniref:EamA family transporter n=1 Tax=Sulfurospirillum diekertiae TaxID=1854492 RepID=A0A6G9VV02_9BACT|nr:EamA family transporter [Sulfurospirillum diekertiae]QIR77016.1 EamA family transporter [Sulfurospirillum diekertiae]QIR79631.1 EamA family transporter [Sulfurospirillum diekertiae]